MGNALGTFAVFLRLGLTSFGGPIAHLGHFRREFVVVRRWMDEAEFVDTVALCQFLPGPTSSQVGFAVGLRRAGLAGGMAALLGFALPSAIALSLGGWMLASGAKDSSGGCGGGWLGGLRAFAAAVVLRAIFGMVRSTAATRGRAALAAGLMLALLAAERAGMPAWIASAAQPLAIAAGAAFGAFAFGTPRIAAHTAPSLHGEPSETGIGQEAGQAPRPASDRHACGVPRAASVLAVLALAGMVALGAFAEVLPPLLQAGAACARAGALVFGGGHVVLPLLEQPFVANGWLPADAVLSGYALAQAVPGPLFTMSAYLGAAMLAPQGLAAAALGAVVLVSALFLPGLLLVLAVLPAWHRLRGVPRLRGATLGAGCAVIGVLAAAFVQDVLPAATATTGSLAIAATAFAFLSWADRPGTGRGLPWIPAPAVPIATAAAAAIAGHFLLAR